MSGLAAPVVLPYLPGLKEQHLTRVFCNSPESLVAGKKLLKSVKLVHFVKSDRLEGVVFDSSQGRTFNPSVHLICLPIRACHNLHSCKCQCLHYLATFAFS